MRQPNVSTELLQTFVTIIEQGGFIRAAQHLHKTQSTISQHIRKLESELGVSLFAVEGRRKLTPMGEQFFSYAKRWLALQEEAVFALAKMELQGEVRIGVSHSLSEGVLPELLARFARTYPQVNLLVETGGSADLIQGYAQGRFDLVLTLELQPQAGQILSSAPMVWMGQAGAEWPQQTPIRLAAYQFECGFRKTAIQTLEQAGLAWQLVYSTNSLAALLAAVRAGLAITLRAPYSAYKGLTILTPPKHLATLENVYVVLRNRAVSEASEWLAEVLMQADIPAT